MSYELWVSWSSSSCACLWRAESGHRRRDGPVRSGGRRRSAVCALEQQRARRSLRLPAALHFWCDIGCIDRTGLCSPAACWQSMPFAFGSTGLLVYWFLHSPVEFNNCLGSHILPSKGDLVTCSFSFVLGKVTHWKRKTTVAICDNHISEFLNVDDWSM